MQVNSIQKNNVDFQARFISPAKIKIKDNEKWQDLPVSFVKFSPEKDADIDTIHNVEKLWNGRNLSGAISEEVDIMGRDTAVYGITAQRDGFENINAKSVLGLMTTDKLNKTKSGLVKIFKLGAKPEFAYEQNGRSRYMKHIGEAMVQEFSKLVLKFRKFQGVYTEPERNEIRFLEKLKFDRQAEDKFVLDRDKFNGSVK